MKYRADIDGLRAFAVLPVVLFHAGFGLFSGGYVGVDIFFVISGYLITSIISSEIDAGNFSFVRFYERRIRRIFPALYVVVFLSLPFSWWLLTPAQLKDFGQSMVAVTLFASNILFFLESGYFEAASELKPLLHTWTLAIEEQYYLIFPFLLLFFKRVGWTRSLFLFLFLSSLIFTFLRGGADPSEQFYMLHYRAWELLAGAAVSIFALDKLNFKAWNNSLSVLGLLLIGFSVFWMSSATAFPSIYSLAPVLGAFLIIVTDGSYISKNILGNKVLVSIGLVSYSLYLFHQPIIVFFNVFYGGHAPFIGSVAAVLITFGLSYLSYHYIEAPFRGRKISRNKVFWLASVVVTCTLLVGFAIHVKNGFSAYRLVANSSTELGQKYLMDVAKIKQERRDLWADYFDGSESESFQDTSGEKILILGDSLAEDFYVSVKSQMLIQSSDVELRMMRLDDTCLSSLGRRLSVGTSEACRNEIRKINESGLVATATKVLYTVVWQSFTSGNVMELVDFVGANNRKLMIFGSSCFTDTASLAYSLGLGRDEPSDLEQYFYSKKRVDWSRENDNVHRILSNNGKKDLYYERYDIFCGKDVVGPRHCKLRDNDEWLLFDGNHLTLNGIRFFGKRVFELGWLQ
jgi:peptidoglycan/LPS O-acetylase OafA/YrhL